MSNIFYENFKRNSNIKVPKLIINKVLSLYDPLVGDRM